MPWTYTISWCQKLWLMLAATGGASTVGSLAQAYKLLNGWKVRSGVPAIHRWPLALWLLLLSAWPWRWDLPRRGDGGSVYHQVDLVCLFWQAISGSSPSSEPGDTNRFTNSVDAPPSPCCSRHWGWAAGSERGSGGAPRRSAEIVESNCWGSGLLGWLWARVWQWARFWLARQWFMCAICIWLLFLSWRWQSTRAGEQSVPYPSEIFPH